MVAAAQVDPLDLACHTDTMPSSPNQLSPGKQYELRVAASDLTFDDILSRLTLPASRAALPGYLHLFSERRFHLDINDRDIDGHSHTETKFRGFQMRITKHNRNKYSLEPEAEKGRLASGEKGVHVRVGLQIGIQAASELMIAPFFTPEERNAGVIPMYYTIPDPVHARAMNTAFNALQEYVAENPRGIVDELTLVESALRMRAIRQRVRPDNSVQAPLQMLTPESEPRTQGDELREVS